TRHSRESGNPGKPLCRRPWTPASAGVTDRNARPNSLQIPCPVQKIPCGVAKNSLLDALPTGQSQAITMGYRASSGPSRDFSLFAGNSLRPDLLALEGDVGDDENDDRRRDEPRELRPNQDEALRGRQRRPEERALQLADQDRPEGTRRGVQQ